MRVGDHSGRRKRNPSKAPNGSAIPERKENQKAFFLLPVAWYIGTLTASPSGILWIAMAMTIGIAISTSVRATGESGEAFRKVVYSDSQGDHYACTLQLPGFIALRRLMYFVRVFVFGNKVVNKSNQTYTDEKKQSAYIFPAVCRRKSGLVGQQPPASVP